MSDRTKIEWADATVNAVNGCSVVSPGCTNCYAMKQAHRFDARRCLTTKTKGGMVWTGEVRLNENQLLQPLRWKRARRIFWNAHGDLFHDNVPDEWIDRCFAVMALTPQHVHMVLTKRPERMREWCDDSRGDWSRTDAIWSQIEPLVASGAPLDPDREIELPLPNVWLGTSVEDQRRADERIPHLLATPAAVRFLSCEPLLGGINVCWALGGPLGIAEGFLRRGHFSPGLETLRRLDWIIVGGESGPGARPMHPNWARTLRDQCAAAEVPFFFKQWGEWAPSELGTERKPISLDRDGSWVPSVGIVHGDEALMASVGKKRAGRLLDGVEHSGFPT